jgi:hypothetical protein
MRDIRFKAMHRCGSLDRYRHRLLAAWAANCAEHVLSRGMRLTMQHERLREMDSGCV